MQQVVLYDVFIENNTIGFVFTSKYSYSVTKKMYYASVYIMQAR